MLIVRSPVRISFGGGGTDLPSYFEKYGGAVLSTLARVGSSRKTSGRFKSFELESLLACRRSWNTHAAPNRHDSKVFIADPGSADPTDLAGSLSTSRNRRNSRKRPCARQAVREFSESYSNGIEVCLSEEPLLLGSAGTLLTNRAWLGSRSPFLVFYSDVLTYANLVRMLEHHKTCSQVATLGVCEVSDPTRCGIVTIDEKNVVREFVEKPQKPSSNLAFSGIIVCEPSLLDFIPNQIPADIGFHVLPKLVRRMAAYRISDYLLDIGTPETYKAAQLDWPGIVD
jgi:mannose-1-phosphate guanylyltransferase